MEDAVVELISLLQESALLPTVHTSDGTDVAQTKKGNLWVGGSVSVQVSEQYGVSTSEGVGWMRY